VQGQLGSFDRSMIGAAVGSAGAAIGLIATGGPLPGWDSFSAVGILAIITGLAAALAPALAAARRDLLKELRVPYRKALVVHGWTFSSLALRAIEATGCAFRVVLMA
jgi:hypothetical protein